MRTLRRIIFCNQMLSKPMFTHKNISRRQKTVKIQSLFWAESYSRCGIYWPWNWCGADWRNQKQRSWTLILQLLNFLGCIRKGNDYRQSWRINQLIIDSKTERILGAELQDQGAGDLIAEAVLAIEMGANAADLKLTIHPHPTLSETIMESAEVFFRAKHPYLQTKEMKNTKNYKFQDVI